MKRTPTKPAKPQLRRISVNIEQALWSQLTRYRQREGRTVRGIVVQGIRRVLNGSKG